MLIRKTDTIDLMSCSVVLGVVGLDIDSIVLLIQNSAGEVRRNEETARRLAGAELYRWLASSLLMNCILPHVKSGHPKNASSERDHSTNASCCLDNVFNNRRSRDLTGWVETRWRLCLGAVR